MASHIKRSRPRDVSCADVRWRQLLRLVSASTVLISVTAAFISAPARASKLRAAHSHQSIFHPVSPPIPTRPVFSPGLHPPLAGHSVWLPASAPTMAGASGWKVQPTPNPSLPNGYLAAVSCSSVTNCTAVGDFENDAAVTRTLAMHWNGGRWRVQATPNPPGAIASTLSGVSCTTTACVAVGYYVNRAGSVLTLAERWNGTTWSIQGTRDPAGAVGSWLFAVTCTSARACTAVGDYENALAVFGTLAERWNGARWVVQRTIDPPGAFSSNLFGVSCTSARACAAVGDYVNTDGTTVTLAERWNGARWRRQTIPNQPGASGSALSAVSCAKASACIAVGRYTSSEGTMLALAEGWNGSRWTIQATLKPGRGRTSELDGVWCASANACTAAGSYTNTFGTSLTLAERWNGSGWAIQSTPNVDRNVGGKLTAISCGSARRCTAVGYNVNPVGMDVTMGQEWNGVAWRDRTTPNLVGAVPTRLSGVSCVSNRDCTAVGDYAAGFHRPTAALAERWNGTRWSVKQTSRLPGAVASEFSGVSCVSPQACTAVGSYLSTSGMPLALVEAWNGHQWSAQTTPVPAGADASQLLGVSCTSARSCTAVGSFFLPGGTSQALAERWDGRRWRIQAVPKPAGRLGAGLTGVSCATALACTSVGYSITPAGYLFSLAERWTGAGWTIQATPGPAGSNASAFTAVSCTSRTACTASGAFDRHGPEQAFADVLKGMTWSVRTIPRPPGAQVSELDGVSCTLRHGCVAAGNYVGASEAWTAYGALATGDKWTLQFMPMPAITFQSVLGGVSCATSRCVAVGYRLGWSGIQVSLVVVKSWPTINRGG